MPTLAASAMRVRLPNSVIHIMKNNKAQIAIEFLVIFSFVLIIFTFFFVLIVNQRASGMTDQTFAQAQLIAQSVATQIATAYQAGNGYSNLMLLSSSIGNIPFNVSVTKNGVVVVSALSVKQVVHAVAYSGVDNIFSSSAYLTNSVYLLPTSNGSIYLQNSFGTICIDYSCPATSNQPATVSIQNQLYTAAVLNGVSGYLDTDYSSSPYFSNTETQLAWVYLNALPNTGNTYYVTSQRSGIGGMYITATGNVVFNVYTGGANMQVTSSNSIVPGQWYMLSGMYSSTASTEGVCIYNVTLSGCNTISATGTITASANELYIGANSGLNSFFNGRITNIQIYNISLSNAQLQGEFYKGINAPPISPSNSIKAWYPFTGGTGIDFSGNNVSLVAGTPVVYTSGSEIETQVKNSLGKNLGANVLVGFQTSLGNFSDGLGPGGFTASYTNNSGVAIAFLNQQANNGNATVKVSAFNGNASVVGSLAAWYPMNFGLRNKAYDLSLNQNTGGLFGNFTWTYPDYVASFNGKAGYIEIPSNTYFDPGQTTSNIVVSAWVNFKAVSGNQLIVGKWVGANMEYQLRAENNQLKFYIHIGSNNYSAVAYNALVPNTWYFVVGKYNSGASKISLFINGVMVGANTLSNAVTSTLAPVYIGGRNGTKYTDFFNGSIANIQISHNDIPANVIESMYMSGIDGVSHTSSATSPGLVARYPLDGDAFDYSGNNFNGTLIGNVSFTPISSVLPMQFLSSGGVAKTTAASFNGVISYVALPPLQLLNHTTNASISAWVNPQPFNHNVIIFAETKNSLGFAPVMQLFINGTSQVEADFGTGIAWMVKAKTVGSNSLFDPIDTVPSWYNIVATWESGTGVNIYINGVKQQLTYTLGSAATTGTLVIPYNPTTYIGYNGTSAATFNGRIANLQLYNVNLTSTQTQRLYYEGLSGLPVNQTGLVAWYQLDGAAIDYGRNGYNGTATNVIYADTQITQPSLTSSLNGTGINFNSKFGYAILPVSSSLESSQFTISFFANPSAMKGTIWLSNDNYFGAGNSGNNGWRILSSSSSYNGVYLATFNGVTEVDSNTLPVKNMSWTQFAFTYGGGVISSYENGKFVGNVMYSQNYLPSLPLGNGNYMVIGGGDGGDPTSFFNGSISNLQIYGSVLNQQQISQLYASPTSPSAQVTVPMSWFP